MKPNTTTAFLTEIAARPTFPDSAIAPAIDVGREERIQNFYRRFAAALAEPESRKAFERQVNRAEIIRLDDEHDEFRFAGGRDPADALNEDTLEGIYPDADGQDVNVILHFVGDHISWSERYRNFGDAIHRWPPSDDVPLRLGRGEWPK